MPLYDKIKGEHLGEICYGPVDVYLNERNAFQPDIFFISEKRKHIIQRKGLVGAPDLVIEILSDNTAVYDRTTKKDVYEQTGVKEYWMIEPDSKQCEGFRARQGKFEPIKPTKGSFHVQLVDLPIQF